MPVTRSMGLTLARNLLKRAGPTGGIETVPGLDVHKDDSAVVSCPPLSAVVRPDRKPV